MLSLPHCSGHGVESHEIQPRAEQQDEEAETDVQRLRRVWAHDGVTRE